MKKITIFLFTILILSLSSCDFNFESFLPHTHSYEKQYDENNHYDYCSCGEKINEVSHNFSEWEIITAATITHDGLRTRKCKECDYSQSEILDKVPHTHKYGIDLVYNEDYHYYECECHEPKDKEPHSFSDWKILSIATMTNPGSKERECSVCGYIQNEIIPIITHKCEYSTEYKYTDLYHYVECSCGAKSYEEHEHSFKSEVYTEGGIDYLKASCKCGHYITNQLNQSLTSNYGYKKFKELNEKYALFYADLYTEINNFANSKTNVSKIDNYYQIASLDYSKYSLTSDEAMAIWSIIHLENPQFYFISNVFTFTEKKLNVCIYEDYKNYTARSVINNDIKQMVMECSLLIEDTDNDVTKALKIHDFLINRIDYAYESDGITPQDDCWAHSIVGMAQKKGGVCESYSKSYKYLCTIFGIESILVTGYSKNQNHAWNMIKLDDIWYHADLTWDDQKIVMYNYFGSSDEKIKKDHTIKVSSKLELDYLYEVPETAYKSIELVTLYENSMEIGQFTSIDKAFEAITNEKHDYQIKLHLYEYNESEKRIYITSNYIYTISKLFPIAKSIKFYALEDSYASNFNAITDLHLIANNVLFSDLYLTNIHFKTNDFTFTLSKYDITFTGYNGGITGYYSATGGEVIKNTIK